MDLLFIKGNQVTKSLIDIWNEKTYPGKSSINTITTNLTKLTPLFYANDFNGYMGYYLEETNLVEVYPKEKVTHFYIELSNQKIRIPNNYEDFFLFLIDAYPSEVSGLAILKTKIQQVGQEWFEFVTSGLNWGLFMTLRHTLKHSEKNFLNVVDELISNNELYEIFLKLQPYNGDIGFNTMAGYLYKQFFDMHKMPSFWNDIFNDRIPNEMMVGDSEGCSFIDSESREDFQNYYTYYSLVLELKELSLNSVLLSNLEVGNKEYNFMLWPLDFVQVNAEHFYKLDVAIPQHIENFEEIYDSLKNKLEVYTTSIKICERDYIPE